MAVNTEFEGRAGQATSVTQRLTREPISTLGTVEIEEIELGSFCPKRRVCNLGEFVPLRRPCRTRPIPEPQVNSKFRPLRDRVEPAQVGKAREIPVR
jgi:hypothetical protein